MGVSWVSFHFKQNPRRALFGCEEPRTKNIVLTSSGEDEMYSVPEQNKMVKSAHVLKAWPPKQL